MVVFGGFFVLGFCSDRELWFWFGEKSSLSLECWRFGEEGVGVGRVLVIVFSLMFFLVWEWVYFLLRLFEV